MTSPWRPPPDELWDKVMDALGLLVFLAIIVGILVEVLW